MNAKIDFFFEIVNKKRAILHFSGKMAEQRAKRKGGDSVFIGAAFHSIIRS